MELINTKNHVCIICYNNENYTLKCADNFCNTRICSDCFETYLQHCLSENSLVKCLNSSCKCYIISDSFEKDNKYMDLYKNVLINAFIQSQSNEVKDIINIENMISNIRKDRQTFIKTFPKAIELVIDIALNKKLNKIKKNNILFIKNEVKSSNRLCMNSHCNGKMDNNFTCLKCSTIFCKKCEKIKKENHVCKKEDIESLELISMIPRCPNCHIAIEKSEGCNGMTCSSCKTIFDYRTGELTDHGSNNFEIGPLKDKFKFEFKKLYPYDIIKKLTIIEGNEPLEPSINALNNIIKKVLIFKETNENDNFVIGNNIVKTFEKYLKNKINYIKFINITIYVNELHQNQKLTLSSLEDIISKNNW